MSSLTSEERLKYEKAWSLPKYRNQSPGERSVEDFLTFYEGGSVVDIGCGTGRASLKIKEAGVPEVKMFDIAENCLDENVPKDTLVLGCLWEDEIPSAAWGFCCDVMEHIPEEKVDAALDNIKRNTKNAYIRIHLGHDVFGPTYLKQPLHLTVQPVSWWMDKITDRWDSVFHIAEGKTLTIVISDGEDNGKSEE